MTSCRTVLGCVLLWLWSALAVAAPSPPMDTAAAAPVPAAAADDKAGTAAPALPAASAAPAPTGSVWRMDSSGRLVSSEMVAPAASAPAPERRRTQSRAAIDEPVPWVIVGMVLAISVGVALGVIFYLVRLTYNPQERDPRIRTRIKWRRLHTE